MGSKDVDALDFADTTEKGTEKDEIELDEDGDAFYQDFYIMKILKEVEDLGKGQSRMERELLALRHELHQSASKELSTPYTSTRQESHRDMETELAAIRKELASMRDGLCKLPGLRRQSTTNLAMASTSLNGDEIPHRRVSRVFAVEKEDSRISSQQDAMGAASTDAFGYNIRQTIPPPPLLPPSWPTSVERRKFLPGANGLSGSFYVSDDAAVDRATKNSTELGTRSVSSIEISDPFVMPSKKRYTLDPNSNFCIAYSLSTIAFLCHDSFMIPWTLAWELRYEGPILYMAWISCIFWTIDMILGFFMGYYHEQVLEYRLRYTIRKYARTWFVPDVCVVVVDWFGVLTSLTSSVASQPARMVRIAKAGKMVRLMGLLRMTKVVKIFEDYVESSLSEFSRLTLRLLQFFLGILWMCHLICCSWFAVGRLEGDTAMNWTSTLFIQNSVELPYMEAGMFFQYVTALHWSMAQFTLGATEIGCYNSYERMFNMMCILIGLIGGSMLVSSLSATMVDYQMVRKEKTQKLTKLRRYLRENRRTVTKATALLVQQQAQERLKVTDKLQESDVQVLSLVSNSLRMELRFELFRPLLHEHGLFQMWLTLDARAVQKICIEGIEYNHYRPQDELFLANSITGQAHHLALGTLDYVKDPDTAPVEDVTVTQVSLGSWIAEASLWSNWVHVGTAKARTTCEVLSVDASSVDTMMQHNPEVHHVTLHYAKMFHRGIQSSCPPRYQYPDDLQVSTTHFDEIIMSMNPMMLRRISLQIIGRAWHGNKNAEKLKQEVNSGKSCVVMNADGSIQRMVSVVVLRLQDSMGRVLTEIGKTDKDGHHFAPSCQLPGNKQEQGETTHETLVRTAKKVGVDMETLDLRGVERTIQYKFSSEVGVHTKYLRKVHTASFKEEEGRLRLSDFSPMAASPPSSKHTVTLMSASRRVSRHRVSIQDSMRRASIDGSFMTTFLTAGDETGNVFIDKRKEGQSVLYAWLSKDVFDFLSSTSGEEDLARWVQHLNSYFAEPTDLRSNMA